MPGIIYEATVSDAGSAIMGGTRVYYVAWEVTILGPGVRTPNNWDASVLLGVGHWELGNDLTSGGLISGVGWGKPNWMDTEIGQIVVAPGIVGAEFTALIQQYFRWTLSPGTTAHFVVFGDT